MEKEDNTESNSMLFDNNDDVMDLEVTEDPDTVLRVRKDGEGLSIYFYPEITSAELIFLIKYLKNTSLPALIRKELE